MNLDICSLKQKPLIIGAISAIAATLACTSPISATDNTTDSQDIKSKHSATADQLVGVVIVSRHGNRSPLKKKEALDSETSSTWPEWNIEPGYLTARGRKLMVGMGNYYRERFIRDGLLTGNDAEDVKHAWIHTNTIQRTIQTGCALAEGLFPSTTTTVHYLVDKKDDLYYGSAIDDKMEDASIDGRIGNDVDALTDSMDLQFDLIEKSMGHPGLYVRKLSSISLAAGIADNYMCQYCEGMSGDQFAFGRASLGDVQEMLKMLALDFDLKVRTPYLARRRMSNLVGHLNATFEQLATGKHIDGAYGDADDKLFVIAGHDTTISSVAGLLRLDWVLPETGRNLCPPGGALVFELHKKGESANHNKSDYFVRVYYAAQTLTQMHNNVMASLENPPAIAPIFVPGSSEASKHFDSPLPDFDKTVQQAIDPELITPVDDGEQK